MLLDTFEESSLFLLGGSVVFFFSFFLSSTSQRTKAATLTSPICGLYDLYATLNTAFPNMGPINHPTHPKPTVLMPSTAIGSRPSVCAAVESKSDPVMKERPAAVTMTAQTIELASEIRRRVLRRARNLFQVNGSPGAAAAAAPLELAVAVEA